MNSLEFAYVGTELDLFAKAINWKRYWRSKLAPYLQGPRILEVGAGIGGTTRVLCEGSEERTLWLGLEPDYEMYRSLCDQQTATQLPAYCEFRHGTVASLGSNEMFDAAMYIDVLEHIEDDAAEVNQVATHINKNGHLLVLSPAYQFLFSEFDKNIGHYRRYNREMIKKLTPPGFTIRKLFYLDSVGMLTSLANRTILKAPLPTVKQILFWDTMLLPITRLVDPVVGYSFGRSIIGIWQRSE